ncbi:hypothetical protein HPB47_007672 [Ixodes persulcatus]|uniref:Uncharacterized protein n=1 Tax=Ixodes persulcatus TaxID=34615 RepID=A0AC60P6Y9_IXOPE|nr:hypothetical protein HPB47_007672 [Ixodes persulcatus]
MQFRACLVLALATSAFAGFVNGGLGYGYGLGYGHVLGYAGFGHGLGYAGLAGYGYAPASYAVAAPAVTRVASYHAAPAVATYQRFAAVRCPMLAADGFYLRASKGRPYEFCVTAATGSPMPFHFLHCTPRGSEGQHMPFMGCRQPQYVDDTFIILKRANLHDFHAVLNSVHHAIQFTYETEKDGVLPFLDGLVRRGGDGSIETAVYRKPCDTDRYPNQQGAKQAAEQGAKQVLMLQTCQQKTGTCLQMFRACLVLALATSAFAGFVNGGLGYGYGLGYGHALGYAGFGHGLGYAGLAGYGFAPASYAVAAPAVTRVASYHAAPAVATYAAAPAVTRVATYAAAPVATVAAVPAVTRTVATSYHTAPAVTTYAAPAVASYVMDTSAFLRKLESEKQSAEKTQAGARECELSEAGAEQERRGRAAWPGPWQTPERSTSEVWSKTGGNGEPWPYDLGYDDPGVVPQRDSSSDGPGQPAYAALAWERRSAGLDTDSDCEL